MRSGAAIISIATLPSAIVKTKTTLGLPPCAHTAPAAPSMSHHVPLHQSTLQALLRPAPKWIPTFKARLPAPAVGLVPSARGDYPERPVLCAQANTGAANIGAPGQLIV